MESFVQRKRAERTWKILVARYGPGQSNTLQAIGDEFDITRERVRQLAKRELKKFKEHRYPHLGKVEQRLSEIITPIDSGVSQPELEEIINQGLPNGVEDLTALQLISAMRGLVQTQDKDVIQDFPILSLHCCMLNPPVTKHSLVNELLAMQQKRWSYNELAELILDEAGEPLHWRTIISRAEKKGLRSEIYPSSMFNAIQAADHLFARTGQETYGLVAWGLGDVPLIRDIIEQVLEDHGTTMSLGALQQSVNQIRETKYASLIMYLDLYPDFYKSENGEYGLRKWLPPVFKQTLRTPKSLIESAASRKRLD